jgi:uncharacterized membrane protein SpoIIM required for sporulation
MSQERFVAQHGGAWVQVEALLDRVERQRLDRQEDQQLGRLSVLRDDGRAEGDAALVALPGLYRRVCQHLALAQHRGMSAALQDRLNTLALRGQVQLYRRVGGGARAAVERLLFEFPAEVRHQWRVMGLAHLLFYLPTLAIGLGVIIEPALIYEVVDPMQVSSFEEMYDPQGSMFLKERSAGSDTQMFGFYIQNNIGVAYRCMGAGVSLGIGSAIMLIYNGLLLGAVGAHLHTAGATVPFTSFVIGHGAWELTAIVLAGGVGLRLGLTLLAPGGRSRAEALRALGRPTLTLTYGFTVMLVVAAFFEAYWCSSATLPVSVKYAVGGLMWLGVYGWLAFAGRWGRADAA